MPGDIKENRIVYIVYIGLFVVASLVVLKWFLRGAKKTHIDEEALLDYCEQQPSIQTLLREFKISRHESRENVPYFTRVLPDYGSDPDVRNLPKMLTPDEKLWTGLSGEEQMPLNFTKPGTAVDAPIASVTSKDRLRYDMSRSAKGPR